MILEIISMVTFLYLNNLKLLLIIFRFFHNFNYQSLYFDFLFQIIWVILLNMELNLHSYIFINYIFYNENLFLFENKGKFNYYRFNNFFHLIELINDSDFNAIYL